MMNSHNYNPKVQLFENFCRRNQVDGKIISAEICDVPLKLKVASTPRSQSAGYMNADSEPAENEGILFVYDNNQLLGFWMKDVSFPLDIIFFDSNLNYVSHQTMRQYAGEKDSELKVYSSKRPAMFAVELRSGWCTGKKLSSSQLKI